MSAPSSVRKTMGSSSLTAATATTPSGLSYKPTLLEVGAMRFLIMDAPRQTNLHLYIKELSTYRVKDLVRVCESTYYADALQNAGITCHDLEYPDGHSPPPDIIEQWLQLVEATFYSSSTVKKRSNNNNNNQQQQQGDQEVTDQASAAGTAAAAAADEKVSLAVHCVAGLGRAPVLVAIALVEFAHMDAVEAVTLIRRLRKGSINEKQLLYLEGYKRRYKRKGDGSNGANNNCIIL